MRQVVLDCLDVRELAEFYRQLLDLQYRPGDEAPPEGEPDTVDWLVLRSATGVGLAFQQVGELPRSTWPEPGVPQMMHLDTTVGSAGELGALHKVVLSLGGELRYDRYDDPEEPLRVYADPAGHPFCIFVTE